MLFTLQIFNLFNYPYNNDINYRTIWIVLNQPLNKVHTFFKKMNKF